MGTKYNRRHFLGTVAGSFAATQLVGRRVHAGETLHDRRSEAMTAISLGMPEAPPPVLAPRRKTRQIQVGKVGVGSDHPVSVQSMTTTLTSDASVRESTPKSGAPIERESVRAVSAFSIIAARANTIGGPLPRSR